MMIQNQCMQVIIKKNDKLWVDTMMGQATIMMNTNEAMDHCQSTTRQQQDNSNMITTEPTASIEE
eukprot:1956672-Ditylum_brightwellii.AAC.1